MMWDWLKQQQIKVGVLVGIIVGVGVISTQWREAGLPVLVTNMALAQVEQQVQVLQQTTVGHELWITNQEIRELRREKYDLKDRLEIEEDASERRKLSDDLVNVETDLEDQEARKQTLRPE
jgi:hypothetical protein